MMESIPLSALELGIDFEGYDDLAQNIRRMRFLSLRERQRILERADKELPENIISRANELREDLSNDKNVYEISGIPYHKGPPEGQKNFTTAIFDYLLRTRSFESRVNN